MANIDRLARAENELETITKNLEALQARAKAVQQRVLKLRSERILELVKNAGMGPAEVQKLITVYQSGRLLERSSRESESENPGRSPADPEKGDAAGFLGGQEVKTDDETI